MQLLMSSRVSHPEPKKKKRANYYEKRREQVVCLPSMAKQSTYRWRRRTGSESTGTGMSSVIMKDIFCSWGSLGVKVGKESM